MAFVGKWIRISIGCVLIFSKLIFKVIINYMKLNLSKQPLAKDV